MTADRQLAMKLAELERALMAIKPVGSIDGHDVVRRESVRDIVQQRALAAQRAEQAPKYAADPCCERYADCTTPCIPRERVQRGESPYGGAEQAQGAEPVAWAVYWKGLPAGSVPWFVSKGEPRGLHEDQYKVPLYAHAQPQAREPVAFEVWAERNGMRMDRLNSGYYCWTKEAALHSWRREHAQPQAAPKQVSNRDGHEDFEEDMK